MAAGVAGGHAATIAPALLPPASRVPTAGTCTRPASEPFAPTAPPGPAGPCGPVAPREPDGPCGPRGPVAPELPSSPSTLPPPVVPNTSLRSLPRVIELFCSLRAVMLLFRSLLAGIELDLIF